MDWSRRREGEESVRIEEVVKVRCGATKRSRRSAAHAEVAEKVVHNQLGIAAYAKEQAHQILDRPIPARETAGRRRLRAELAGVRRLHERGRR